MLEEGIVSFLVFSKQKTKEIDAEAHDQAQYVDGGVESVLEDMTPCNQQIILEHLFILARERDSGQEQF
jgi:hypothetical protein